MFIVKEMENSDVRCGCVTKSFTDEKSAQKFMKSQFERVKEILGETYADHEQEDIKSEEQRWATINSTAAHIQVGFDAYDWEIAEDPEWVSKDEVPEGFVIVGCKTNNDNGDLIPIVPVYARTETEAKAMLEKVYREELDNRGLQDNDACDENDESCPGGCLTETSADIWDNAGYAFDCLVNVAHFSYFPLKG